MKTHKHIRQGLLIAGFFLAISWGIARLIGVDEIRSFVASYPILAPLVIIIIKAASIIFAPLSGTATYAIAGTVFPIREGMIYMTIGNFIGICTTYRLGRRFGLPIIQWMFGKHGMQQAEGIIDRLRQPKTFIITRILLFPLEDLINYVAGMAKTPFRLFIAVSMVASSLVALSIVLSAAGLLSLNF